jgi:thiamine pyrophosphate-dependent acetolactate synthase large subunit-like protein
MTGKTGHQAIIEQFLADGFTHMFGNPGTVEQGFLDALRDYPEMRYILTLQESVAVMLGDGYARATKKPALVQIHSSPGLGNSIGALYQAMRGHSPLVVIGGDAGIRYLAMDAQMAGDLTAIAAPVCKWAATVTDSRSLLRMVRRAIKIAATPPMGPVYLCLPQDILDEPLVETVQPTSLPSTRVVPDDGFLREAAEVLASARTPMMFIGDGVAYSGAQAEVARIAEILGAEVWECDNGELNMSHAHPLYRGSTGHMFGFQSKPVLGKGDVNLICGTYITPEVFPELGDVFASGSRAIHIDLNAYEIGKNHPVALGVVADPKVTLGRLAEVLESTMSAAQKAAAAARVHELGLVAAAKREADLARDRDVRDAEPMYLSRFMEELAAMLPEDAIIFDEALTNSPPIPRYRPSTLPEQYFLTRGGSLGTGIPGAIGVKLAHPDKTVVGFTGDGGSMYTIQALWTAARHNVDAKFVVCNNRSYRILQFNIQQYWKEVGQQEHDFPVAFDLSQPDLRFADLARGMGVEAIRVERAADIRPAIERALAHPGPFLIDLILEGDVHPDRVEERCGH